MLAASFLVTVFYQHKTVRGCVIANVSHRKNAERRVLNVAACWTEELCSFVFACCASPTLSHDLLPLSHFLFLIFFFSISRDVWTLSRCVLSSRVPESTQLECRREPASFLPVQTVNGEIMLFICYIHFPKPPPISVLSVLHTLSDHNL